MTEGTPLLVEAIRSEIDVVEMLRAYIRPSTVMLAVVFGAVLAFASVFGGTLLETGFSSSDPSTLLAPFGALAALFSILYVCIPLAANVARDKLRVPRRDSSTSKTGAASVIAPDWNRRSIILHALVMFAAWLPYLIAVFPGTMNWDTAYQIDQCYSDGTVWVVPWADTESVSDAHFSDHHPLFDTLLYGVFALSSDKLFGTWNYGVFAFVVLQAIFTAATFTLATAYLGRIGSPRKLTAGVFLFFCLIPFYPFYAASMLKDSTFAPLFVLYFIMLVECARTRGSSLAESKRAVACFVVLGLLLALTKKPGLYIVLLSSLVLVFVYRKAWKAFVLQAGVVVVVMMVLLPFAVFPALNVIPGEKQETLGTLFQQTARFVVQYPNEVTDDERAAIDRVIMFDGIDERYNPYCSDTVKFFYRYDTCTGDDLSNYLRVWIDQGLRHPWTYVESMLVTTAPYITFDGELEVHENAMDVYNESPRVWQPAPLAPLKNAVVGLYHWLLNAPVLFALFRVGLYAYVVPSLVFIALVMRRSRYVPVFIPLALSLAVCIVTPVFHARYALPLLYLTPLLVSLCFEREREAPTQNA